MSPTEQFISALNENGCGPKQSGSSWSAHCPAHEDRRASLSIAEGDDGIAVVKCHAGCETPAVVESLGLEMSDLFPSDPFSVPHESRNRSSNGKPTATYPTPEAAIAVLEGKYGVRSGLWIYHDSSSEPVGLVLRWDSASGKEIRPVARRGNEWVIGGMLEPRPLYNLPTLAGAEVVYVTEGEKAAEMARSIELTATTSAHGSKSAEKTAWEPLAGKRVVLLPDNDTSGKEYAGTVARILATLTPAPDVKVVDLPGLPDHGDIVDWVENHGDAAEPDELRRQIEGLVEDAPVWTPEATNKAIQIRERLIERERARNEFSSAATSGMVLQLVNGIEPREVSWLWPGRIAKGRITLLVGRPGIGKSFLTCDIASRVSTGSPWPDRSPCERGSVLLISAEDDVADTIRPRLDAHCADNKRISAASLVYHKSAEGKTTNEMFGLRHLEELETAITSLPNCRLVVIDPIGSFLGGRCDAHRDNEVRGVLAPIAQLAERLDVAMLIVAHRRKSAAANADDTVMGSLAFTGLARTVWHLAMDLGNKNRRLLLPGKNNLAKVQSGLAFSIGGEPASLRWESEPVDMSADEGVAAEAEQRKPGPTAEATDDAERFLLAALANGPRLAKDIQEEAREGHGISKRTLDRAKKKIGAEAYREKNPGPWSWRLPQDAKLPVPEPQGVELGNLGTVPENKGETPLSGDKNPQDAKLPAPGEQLGNLASDDDDWGEV